jgi:hypothetical protein
MEQDGHVMEADEAQTGGGSGGWASPSGPQSGGPPQSGLPQSGGPPQVGGPQSGQPPGPPFPFPPPGRSAPHPVARQVPPPAGGFWRPPKRIEPVPGTPFAVAYLDVPQTTSGPATGALVAGIGSLLAMLLVGCFGTLAAQADAGPLVGGAFGMLSLALGTAGVGLGLVGLRQIHRYRVHGRGLAIAGISCGAAGGGLTLAVMLLLLVAA